MSSAPAPEDRLPYQVLARRFRPRRFEELVGQNAIETSLRSALATGRVPHAFLFSGSRGVGKTTTARILARCLNCEEGVSASPCGTCRQCRTILDGSNSDVMEIDAASHNLVDDIRELRDRVGFASMGARYKVYILDEVHMLTRNAFNAFLKTLEEPPANVVFILATTELHKVPDTIRSRCQVLLFQRVAESDIVRRLQAIVADEGVQVADEVLAEIARSAQGGMRDSETALERILPVAREKDGAAFGLEDYRRMVHRTGLDEVVEVVGSLLEGEAAAALRLADRLIADGVDEREALGDVLEVLRALLLLRIDGAESGLITYSGELRTRLEGMAAAAEVPRLDAMIQAVLNGRERLRRTDDRRVVLEITFVRVAQAGRLADLAELVELARSGQLGGSAAPHHALPTTSPAAPAGTISTTPAAPGGEVFAEPGSMKARLLELCTRRQGILTRTLELCSFEPPDADGVVKVTVETELRLHRDRMQSEGVRQDVTTMLSEVLGKPVRVVVAKAGPVGEPPADSRSPAVGSSAGSQLEPGPAVRKVMQRFDGRVVDVDRSQGD